MKYVAYYRVSTHKQGMSGLGLAAQKSAVRNFLKNIEPIEEFTDVETGTNKGNKRSALQQAIRTCRETDSILVIAKLDRLARNVRFITTLLESSVEFVACDMPTANKFTIHIFAALAEQEAEMISHRTKAALMEAKKRGMKLGKPENLTFEAIHKGLMTRKNNALANENNRKAGALIVSMRNEGRSFYGIIKELNRIGFNTRRGHSFKIPQAIRLYDRYHEKRELKIETIY